MSLAAAQDPHENSARCADCPFPLYFFFLITLRNVTKIWVETMICSRNQHHRNAVPPERLTNLWVKRSKIRYTAFQLRLKTPSLFHKSILCHKGSTLRNKTRTTHSFDPTLCLIITNLTVETLWLWNLVPWWCNELPLFYPWHHSALLEFGEVFSVFIRTPTLDRTHQDEPWILFYLWMLSK